MQVGLALEPCDKRAYQNAVYTSAHNHANSSPVMIKLMQSSPLACCLSISSPGIPYSSQEGWFEGLLKSQLRMGAPPMYEAPMREVFLGTCEFGQRLGMHEKTQKFMPHAHLGFPVDGLQFHKRSNVLQVCHGFGGQED